MLHDPFLRVADDVRLRDELLGLGFKIYAAEFRELGTAESVGGSIDSFVANCDAVVRQIGDREPGRSIMPLAFSVAALPFLYYYFSTRPPIDVLALISPILSYVGAPFPRAL
ncbi:MAG: hypothetical protein QF497_03645, partial [Verrucomicrobiota bacterium]|nr:hypothetical protein [Verrucomicrobiota bacterium]